MNKSDCCGVETIIEFRTDHPLYYDDPYHFQIPVQVCSKCGRVIGLITDSDQIEKD